MSVRSQKVKQNKQRTDRRRSQSQSWSQSKSQSRSRDSSHSTERNSKAKSNDPVYVYGIHAVTAVLQRRPDQVKALWLQEGRQDQRIEAIQQRASQIGLKINQANSETLEDFARGERHQGVVAWFSGSSLWSEAELKDLVIGAEQPPFVMVLDGVTDPHNLGACLRSANGAGVDVVIAPKDKSASLTAVARKVACGAAEATPFVQVTNLSRTLKQLQEWGVWIIGLADEEDGCLYDSRLTGPLAIVMGAEGSGLRRLTRENCDEICALPMQGSVSSLNVSVAAGVCAYEVLRQRRSREV